MTKGLYHGLTDFLFLGTFVGKIDLSARDVLFLVDGDGKTALARENFGVNRPEEGDIGYGEVGDEGRLVKLNPFRARVLQHVDKVAVCGDDGLPNSSSARSMASRAPADTGTVAALSR